MHISRTDQRPVGRGRLPGKGGNIMEDRNLFRQPGQLPPVQAVAELRAAEEQADLTVGEIFVQYMMGHRPERRYSRSRANKKKIFFDGLRQGENPLRPPKDQLAANGYLIEQISCSGAAL